MIKNWSESYLDGRQNVQEAVDGKNSSGPNSDSRPELVWVANFVKEIGYGQAAPQLVKVTEDERRLLEQANDFVRRTPKPRCGLKTVDQYQKIFNRVREKEVRLSSLKTKSNFFKYKAAVQGVARMRLLLVLKKYSQRKLDSSLLNGLRQVMDVLGIAGILEPYKGCPIEGPAKKSSKRRSLGIPGWQNRMWNACREDTKYRAALAVLHLAGVRPAEIEKGVWVAADPDAGLLTLTVQGAKTGREGVTGQPWRTISINSRGREYGSPEHYLEKLALLDEGAVQVTGSAHNLCDFVRRLADKEFGKKKHKISPYSYRHQLASDLKGDGGFSRNDIAGVLGHQSDRTQKGYGSFRQSTGGRGIESVRTAKKVRMHEVPRDFPRSGGKRMGIT